MRDRLENLQQDVVSGEQNDAERLGLDLKEYAMYGAIKSRLDQIEQAAKDKTQPAAPTGALLLKEPEQIGYADINDTRAKEITLAAEKTIEQNAVVDWTTSPTKTSTIERELFRLFNMHYHALLPLPERKSLVAELIALAKKHFAK